MKTWITMALCAAAVTACTPTPETSAAPGAGEASVAQAGIEGVEWHLVELNGAAVTPGSRGAPTLTFDAGESRAAGFAGCNRYFAGYTRSGATLRFADIGATRMACTDDGAMELETNFLRALEATESHAASAGTLTLSGGGRTLARFTSTRT
ncbi:MAG TPA: META domain-containing protein [Longimicrobium sp.]|nr:META domain-containing protein [Longimicrobium sp.]